MMCPIEAISNELEFGVSSISAAEVIALAPASLGLTPEINERDVIEANVSLFPDVSALNAALPSRVRSLSELVERAGGRLYGGGAVLEDVRDLEPARKLTTALSDTLARGFLEISSQQVVIGMTDEQGGLQAHEALRVTTPFLLALSLATPYRVTDGLLQETGLQSIRPSRYRAMCANLPPSMWLHAPSYTSLREYEAHRERATADVKRLLATGELDTHPSFWELGHASFDLLAPHQLYQPVRLRPDHDNRAGGGHSLFSIEARMPDMPLTMDGICLVNSFAYGIAYAAATEGIHPLYHALGLDLSPDGELHDVALDIGRRGLDVEYPTGPMRTILPRAVAYAAHGLRIAGLPEEAERLKQGVARLLRDGSEADKFRAAAPRSLPEARTYLADTLVRSLEAPR